MKKLCVLIAFCIASVSMLAQTNLQRAKQAADAEDHKAVIEYTTKHLQSYPASSEAYTLRSAAYASLQEYGKALKDADRAIACWKKGGTLTLSDVYAWRGTVYQMVGDKDKALADFNTCVKKGKNDPDAYTARAQFFYDEERYAEAEADYRMVAKLKPEDSDPMVEVARCLLQQHDDEAGKAILEGIVKLEPLKANAHYLLAYCAMNADRNRECVDHCIAFLSGNHQGNLSMLQYEASVEYNYVIKSVSMKVSETARDMRDNNYWLSVRGRVYESCDKYSDALEDFKKMEAFLGDSLVNPFVYYHLGLCYSNLYDYKSALKYYDMLVNLEETANEPSYYSYASRAQTLHNLGENERSIEDCNRAIDLDYEGSSYMYYLKGLNDEELHRYDAALTDYTNSIVADDSNSFSYMMRGRLYLQQKHDTVAANADFNRILEIDTVAESSSCREYAFLYLGRIEEAKDWTSRIIASEPENPGVYYDAACVYSLIGKPEAAISHLRTALNKGYANFRHMENDSDLDNIRETEEYKALLAEFRKTEVRNLFNRLK